MKRFLVFLILPLVIGVSGFAQEKTLTAAADPWPPYVDQKNPTDGLSLEIIREALKTEGYTVTMSYVPWTRAEDGVKNGTIDILPDTWMTKRSSDFLAFSDPYTTNELKFIKRKGDPFEYAGLDSLKGKKVGIVKDYGYNDDFLSSKLFTKEETFDLMTNIRKLIAGHIDLTLEDPIVATALMNAADPKILPQVEFTKSDLSTVSLYLCVGLKNPRSKEIITAFNSGLTKIKANGTYKKIFQTYGF